MRRNAEGWLRLAEKVYHYRRDLLTEAELQEFVSASTHLQETLRRKEDASKLRLASEQMDDALRKYGGPYYRRSGWGENIEVLLVAAILAIGIRTYFVQPFKIPTNSMWPTYYGMTHEVFVDPDDRPGPVGGVVRRAAFGAKRHTIEAPVDGEVRLLVQPAASDSFRARIPPVGVVSSRSFFIFPGQAYQYHLYVGETPVAVDVPVDFQIDGVFHEAFFDDVADFDAAVRAQNRRQNTRNDGNFLIDTGKRVRQGDVVLDFDILTGDQLFVDRMSYHFVRPKIGDGFVFRTGEIPGLRAADGSPEDKYYIKRLVGIPGDELEIEPPELLRNGDPIDGRPVFEKIQDREGRYVGYVNSGILAPGRTATVPENHFFALGDNSPNSLDGRNFGFVPEGEVVGRSLFIYYPFTKRWGPAR